MEAREGGGEGNPELSGHRLRREKKKKTTINNAVHNTGH